MAKSKLEFYSLGMVAQDIAENSFEVEVFPMEITTAKGGDLNAPSTANTSSVSSTGEHSNTVVDRNRNIKATWLALGASNRITPPNVSKGETVMIYNYAGTDKYYWVTMDNEMDLRQNEKATFFFSNKKGVVTDGLLEKSYYFTVDCINKFIRLFTNKNDGEYTTWDVSINTEKGVMSIKDGKGNFIELDSSKDKLTITTLKDVEVNTKFTVVNSTDKVTVNTKVAEVNASESATLNTKVSTVNASDSATIKTNTCTISSSQCNIN